MNMFSFASLVISERELAEAVRTAILTELGRVDALKVLSVDGVQGLDTVVADLPLKKERKPINARLTD